VSGHIGGKRIGLSLEMFHGTPDPLLYESRARSKTKFVIGAAHLGRVLSAPDANGWASSMMAHDQNPHDIANDTK
jgi:hypothetical protein